MLASFISELRKRREWTQELMASQLGMSRPTYIQIERGERDITIAEAKTLAGMFGIPIGDFVQGIDSSVQVELPSTASRAQEAPPELRISVPQQHVDKFKEVLLYCLTKVGSKPNVGETVLYKLLYFIDFDFYEKYEEQLIGATYIKNHFGPTPVEFKAIVDEMIRNHEIMRMEDKYFGFPRRKYLPCREPDLTKLKDARELQHIDEVLARLGDKNANALTEYSHEDVPWITAEENTPLDYEAVFYRTPKTSVRNYGERD